MTSIPQKEAPRSHGKKNDMHVAILNDIQNVLYLELFLCADKVD